MAEGNCTLGAKNKGLLELIWLYWPISTSWITIKETPPCSGCVKHIIFSPKTYTFTMFLLPTFKGIKSYLVVHYLVFYWLAIICWSWKKHECFPRSTDKLQKKCQTDRRHIKVFQGRFWCPQNVGKKKVLVFKKSMCHTTRRHGSPFKMLA